MSNTEREVFFNKSLFLFPVFSIIIALLACRELPDSNWDLMNYHLYNGYAIVHNRLSTDIIPAQEQTFLHPLQDIVGYILRKRLNHHPIVFNAVWSIPHGIAAFLAFRILLLLIPRLGLARVPAAMLGAAFGVSGAAGWPTLVLSMSEMIPDCFVLGAIWLLIRELQCGSEAPSMRRRPLALAGVFFGVAVGFKLVDAIYPIAATATCLVMQWRAITKRGALTFIIGGVVGVVIIGGPWYLHLYLTYGNPFFPFYNHIFHSPWTAVSSHRDLRALPEELWQWIIFPATWAFNLNTHVLEAPFRDPRFLIDYVCVICTILLYLLQRYAFGIITTLAVLRSVFACLFFGAAFAVWEAQFSIFRYTAALELISAAPIISLLAIVASEQRALVYFSVLGILWIPVQAATSYPPGGHAYVDDVLATVDFPKIPNDSLVILLDGAPMAFVAAFAPPSIVFVGANNNLVSLQTGYHSSLLDNKIDQTINEFTGPLYGLQPTDDYANQEQLTLERYRLRRMECEAIKTNIAIGLKMCRLERTGS